MKLIGTLTTHLIFSTTLLAQWINLPLQVGNAWTYFRPETGTKYKYEVVDSGIYINNNYYYKIISNDGYTSYCRYDKSDSIYYTYRIVYPDTFEITPYFKNKITYSDTVYYQTIWSTSFFYLYFEFPAYVFGTLDTIKWIMYDFQGLVLTERLWSEKFGMLAERDAVTGNVYYEIVGCVINRVVYGDTTVVGVDDYFAEVPTEFELHQNYPNPFNPSTIISWQAPVGSWQTLKIYDILGNDVATLVDEYREKGKYQVEFNASNLPSGVYIYKLTAGSFISSKKMTVIK